MVTTILANMFVTHGHSVSIFVKQNSHKTLQPLLSSSVKVYFGVGNKARTENIIRLHEIYIKEDIQVVINQWGLPFDPIFLLRKAEKGHPVKIISFHHNDPSTNGKIQDVDILLSQSSFILGRSLLICRRYIIRLLTAMSMRYTYHYSDKFMVLSESYLSHLRSFIFVNKSDKQGVLTNPVTIDNSDYIFSFGDKRKEIIYCGRIDHIQKRVCRLVETWSLIEKNNPEWKLIIVGDGDARKDVEVLKERLELVNISIEGFQSPTDYYKRASILVLTSEYEGFPLVLAECMSYGVVPVVYDSFSAVHDIITDGKNGAIVPKKNGTYCKYLMAEKLQFIMKSEKLREEMARNAIKTSEHYSVNNIYKQWNCLFNSLLCN